MPAHPKTNPRRSEPYRRWVASLPCAHCGIVGLSQAAHADEGKGMAIKSGDDTCFPLCCTRVGITGCHHDLGTGRQYPRHEREHIERLYAAETQALAKESGNWPRAWAEMETT